MSNNLCHQIDRPITQQGISGLRTGTARGFRTRQLQDKRYWEELMQVGCDFTFTNETDGWPGKIRAFAADAARFQPTQWRGPKLNSECSIANTMTMKTKYYHEKYYAYFMAPILIINIMALLH